MTNDERKFSINDAAREVLLIALHYPIARTALVELEDTFFYDPAERAVLRAARAMYELEIDYTPDHIIEELERLKDATPDGDEYLVFGRALDLMEGELSTVPRQARPGSRVGELLGQIKRASVDTSSISPRLFRCSDIIGDIVSEARAANDARLSGQLRSPITGFKELDQKIGGALPQVGPCMVLGNTGSGKTAFAVQVAASCGFPSLYVTTEMSPAELFRRQMARHSSTFLGRLKSGEMTPEEVESIAKETASAMPDLAFVDSTTAFANPAYLRECAQRVRGDAKTLLLIVDSLHTWTRGGGGGLNEYEALNQNLLALQRLCHQLECPALVVCEQSRAAIAGGGGVNSGAGSRSIEYGAEIVFDLQAAKDTDSSGERDVSVLIAKNRHGAAGVTVKLSFNGALQRFKVKQEWGAV